MHVARWPRQLRQFLLRTGYRVSGATQRQQARAVLRKGDIDLLIADSVLRGGNGDDVAEAAGRRGMPVIMMSGDPTRIAWLSVGPLPFQPFRAAQLLRLVRQLLP